jgi:hypothetical protein
MTIGRMPAFMYSGRSQKWSRCIGMEPCLARSALSILALSSSMAPTSWATPPTGSPRSSAIEAVWRTRVPPPTPSTMRSPAWCSSASSSATPQDGLGAAVEDALAADADQGDVRHDLQVAVAVGASA